MNALDAPPTLSGEIRILLVSSLDHPEDKRCFDQVILDRLGPSIAAVGLLHYPVVVPDGDRFKIAAGNHRVQVLRLGGATHVCCHVLPVGTTPAQALMCSLHENHVRRNESVADTMKRVNALKSYHGCQSFAEAAELAGIDQSTVSKVRRVMRELSPRCLAIVHEHKLGVGICYEIAKRAVSEEEQHEWLQSHVRGEMPRDAIVQEAKKKRAATKRTSARTRTPRLPKPPQVRVEAKRDDIDVKLVVLESADGETISAFLTTLAQQILDHYRSQQSLSTFSFS